MLLRPRVMGNEDAVSDMPRKENKYTGNYSARFTGRKLVSDIIVVIKYTSVQQRYAVEYWPPYACDLIMAAGNATRTQYGVSARSPRYPAGPAVRVTIVSLLHSYYGDGCQTNRTKTVCRTCWLHDGIAAKVMTNRRL